MKFELLKSLDEVTEFYGGIPETFNLGSDSLESYAWPLDYQELLASDFVRPINELCGTTLDAYDVDWFDAEKCVILKGWLENRLKAPCPSHLGDLYRVLLDYASRAIELGTGVIVEL